MTLIIFGWLSWSPSTSPPSPRSAGRWLGRRTSCGSCGTTSPWTTWTRPSLCMLLSPWLFAICLGWILLTKYYLIKDYLIKEYFAKIKSGLSQGACWVASDLPGHQIFSFPKVPFPILISVTDSDVFSSSSFLKKTLFISDGVNFNQCLHQIWFPFLRFLDSWLRMRKQLVNSNH